MLPFKKILIVEDNPINRTMLKNILDRSYSILEAGNGQEALAVLDCYNDISLILLDLVMPVMDGYTFLSILQKDPVRSAIPVIVTTQNDSEVDEIQSLARGATDFVSKPYRPQIILHRIASILRLRETAAMLKILQYDSLTGLYTREYFFHRAQEELRMHPEKEYYIICSDIENFKLVNDVFGLQAGDRLLQEVAAMCLEQVGNRGICGRFSADRYMCLLERRQTYTEQFFAQLNTRFYSLPLPKHLVIKWGIYQVEDHQLPVSHMCDRALMAVDSIKGRYGKCFSIYDNKLRENLLREQSIEDGMEAALMNREFAVYLQPKYSLMSTGKERSPLVGAEALVRWEHPRWGLLFPGEFIPLFEKNGFITRLDWYVWEQTCALMKKWKDQGYPMVSVSVNISRADVYQADLPERLLELVKQYELLPKWLHLEITESAFAEDPDQVIHTTERLQELGFIIEMDDFGSGYSALNMISRMKLDILKLDMKFLQGEQDDHRNHGVVRLVIDLAKWMSLKVTAEGVETKEQADWLREIGCDYVQGYYFANPMKQEVFAALLVESQQE